MGNIISNFGAAINNSLRQTGHAIEQGANSVQDAVNGAEQVVTDAVNEAGQVVTDAAHGVEQSAGQFVQDRGERLEGIGSKISNGHLVDAAMDAFQAVSVGGKVSDMAHALGMVESPADRALLSGVVNALTGNVVAAAGDGEDFLQNTLHHAQFALDVSGEISINGKTVCAESQHVESPKTKRITRRSRGYQTAQNNPKDLDTIRNSGKFRETIATRIDANPFGGFNIDKESMTSNIRQRTLAAAQDVTPPSGHDAPANESDYASIFSDPSLSFEDKLFYFMALVAKNSEEKIENMMKKYDAAQKQKKDKAKFDKAVDKMTGIGTMAGTAALTALGVPPPISSMIAQMVVSQGADATKEGFTKAQESENDSKKDDDPTKISKKQNEWSEQRWMMELQRLQEQMSKMYQMLSNTMKSMHDTQMTAVRNLR